MMRLKPFDQPPIRRAFDPRRPAWLRTPHPTNMHAIAAKIAVDVVILGCDDERTLPGTPISGTLMMGCGISMSTTGPGAVVAFTSVPGASQSSTVLT